MQLLFVRSDQVAVKVDGEDVPAGTPGPLPTPAEGEVAPGEGWIDYTL